MKEFENELNNEQLELLENIKPDFRDMDFLDLYEWLEDYMQTNGINDIDNKPELWVIEEIIDILADY